MSDGTFAYEVITDWTQPEQALRQYAQVAREEAEKILQQVRDEEISPDVGVSKASELSGVAAINERRGLAASVGLEQTPELREAQAGMVALRSEIKNLGGAVSSVSKDMQRNAAQVEKAGQAAVESDTRSAARRAAVNEKAVRDQEESGRQVQAQAARALQRRNEATAVITKNNDLSDPEVAASLEARGLAKAEADLNAKAALYAGRDQLAPQINAQNNLNRVQSVEANAKPEDFDDSLALIKREQVVAERNNLYAARAKAASLGVQLTGDESLAEITAETAVAAKLAQREQNEIASSLVEQKYANGELQRGSLFQRVQRGIASREGGPPKLDDEYLTGGQFLQSRALTTAGFALSGAALYGAVSGIKSMVSEAEKLQLTLAAVKSQFDQANLSAVAFAGFKKNIVDISTETGIAANELAVLSERLLGIYRIQSPSGKDAGPDVGKAQAELADLAKIAAIAQLSSDEVTQKLVPLQKAFSATEPNLTFSQLGDSIVGVSQRTGVGVKDIIDFTSALAPLAAQAGFSSQELITLAASMEQVTGLDASAVSTSLARVLSDLPSKSNDILGYLARVPELASSQGAVIKDFAAGNEKGVLEELLRAAPKLSQSARNDLVFKVAGRRDDNALQAAFNNAPQILESLGAKQDDTGDLDKRFQTQKDTISQALREASRTLEELGISVLNSGLGQAFLLLAQGLGGVAKAATALLDAFKGVNDFLGGIPSRVIAAALAFNILAKSLEAIKELQLLTGVGKLAGLGDVGEIALGASGAGRIGQVGGVASGYSAATTAELGVGVVGGGIFSRVGARLSRPGALFSPYNAEGEISSPIIAGSQGQFVNGLTGGQTNFGGLSGIAAEGGAGAAALGLASTLGPIAVVAGTAALVKTTADARSNIQKQQKSYAQELSKLTDDQLKNAGKTQDDGTAPKFAPGVLPGFRKDLGAFLSDAKNEHDTYIDEVQKRQTAGELAFIDEVGKDRASKILEAYRAKGGNNSAVESTLKDLEGFRAKLAADPTNNGLQNKAAALVAALQSGLLGPDEIAKVKKQIADKKKIVNAGTVAAQGSDQATADLASLVAEYNNGAGEGQLNDIIDAADRKIAIDRAMIASYTANGQDNSTNITNLNTDQKTLDDALDTFYKSVQDQAVLLGSLSGKDEFQTVIDSAHAVLNDPRVSDAQRYTAAQTVISELQKKLDYDLKYKVQSMSEGLALINSSSSSLDPATYKALIDQQLDTGAASVPFREAGNVFGDRQDLKSSYHDLFDPAKSAADRKKAVDAAKQGYTDDIAFQEGLKKQAPVDDGSADAKAKRQAFLQSIDAQIKFDQLNFQALGDIFDPSGAPTPQDLLQKALSLYQDQSAHVAANQSLANANTTDPLSQAVNNVNAASQDYDNAKLTKDDDTIKNALAKLLEAKTAYVKAQYDDVKSILDLKAAQDQQDPVAAANDAIALADAAAQAATNTQEARAATVQRINAVVQAQTAQEDVDRANLELAAAYAHGDPVAAANAAVQTAEYNVAHAHGAAEAARTRAALVAAQDSADKALVDAQVADLELQSAQETGDPVAQAQTALQIANTRLAHAHGEAERAQAMIQQIQAQQQLQQALLSNFDLWNDIAVALDDASGNTVAALQDKLADIQAHLTQAEQSGNKQDILKYTAQQIQTQAQIRDQKLQDSETQIDFLLQMQQITQGQAIEELSALLKLPGLTQKEIQDLQLKIKQMKDQLGADYQFNLPSDIDLPTLYEARRTVDSGGNYQASRSGYGTATAQTVDNRQYNINIVANNSVDAQQALKTITDAVQAPPRTGARNY